MNRVNCREVLLALAIVSSSGVGAIAQTAPSVPNLIAYQGRVTLAGGAPVADGDYTASFILYSESVGGDSLWGAATTVTTSDGMFSYNLGSSPGSLLPLSLTTANDSLWLEVWFNHEQLTPRTRLVGTAFSLTANQLEMSNGSGTVALRTTPATHQFSQYGTDGGEQIRLWGAGWGELYLDAVAVNASNDDVRLTSNSGNGGRLDLRKSNGTAGASLHGGFSGSGATLSLSNDAGLTTIYLDGDLTGDGAALLPGSSVAATELLNEPGVAVSNSPDTIPITGLTNLVSRTITAPTAGYVIATGTLMLRSNHSFGTENRARFWIEDTTNFVLSLQSEHLLPATIATGGYTNCIHVQSVFSVPSGSHGFVLSSVVVSGNHEVTVPHLTLMFVPTAYGTVAPPSKANLAMASNSRANRNEEEDATAFEHSRMVRELAALREQSEAISRRLEDLDNRSAKQDPQ